jgi:hypothetical protein
MSSPSILSLKEAAEQFHNWRSQYSRKPYPIALWDAAIYHAQKLSIAEVATLLKVSSNYLKAKIEQTLDKKVITLPIREKGVEESPFIEVSSPVTQKQPLAPVEARISRNSELEMAMKFEGALEELIPIIEHLFCRGESL